MSYKHLEKFKWVIGLKSFDKVCDNIPTLLKTISHPNSEFKNTFSDFIQLLDLFYAEFGLDKLDEFIESYKIVKGTLEKYVQYYPNFSKGYVKKFKKPLFMGCQKLMRI